MNEINYKTLANAMRNSQREVVDGSLGQVPVTPTIGRLGQYNVVVRPTPRENSMTSLATALAQAPQLLGQFRNISEKQGQLDAEELSIEEVEERFNNKDTEAEGFFTQLGKQKAFSETMYRRYYDTEVTNGFKDVSHEFDTMPIEELKALGSGQTLEANARQRYADSIDENVLNTIKGDPFMEVMHNRAVGDTISKLAKEAVLVADGRVQDYTKKETANNINAQLLQTFDHIENLEDVSTDPALRSEGQPVEEGTSMLPTLSSEEVDEREADFVNLAVSNLQETIHTITESSNGILDNEQVEQNVTQAIRLGVTQALGKKNYMAVRAMYDAMESGELKVNGRPIEYTKQGAALMVTVQKALEEAEKDKEDPYTDAHKTVVNKRMTEIKQLYLQTQAEGATDEDTKAYINAIEDLMTYTGENPDGLPFEGIDTLQTFAESQHSKSKGLTFENEETKATQIENMQKMSDTFGLKNRTAIARVTSLAMVNQLLDEDPSLGQILGGFTEEFFDSKLDETRNIVTNLGKEELMQLHSRAVDRVLVNETNKLGLEKLTFSAGEALDKDKIEDLNNKIKAQMVSDLQYRLKRESMNNPPPTTPSVVEDPQGRPLEERQKMQDDDLFNEEGQFEGRKVRKANPSAKAYDWEEIGGVESTETTVYNLTKLTEVIKDPNKRALMNKANSPEKVAEVAQSSVTRAYLNHDNKRNRITYVSQSSDIVASKQTYVKRSELLGLPLAYLLKSGGVETARIMTKDGFLWNNEFSDRTINYDMGKSLSGQGQSKKRIYNVKALVEANKGNDTNMRAVFAKWQEPTGITYEEFFKNQSTLYTNTIAPLPEK